MDKFLKYNHPAVAPKGIEIERSYSLAELQKRFSLDQIKCFFKPENFEWSELEKATTK
jgi:hypothetical protein